MFADIIGAPGVKTDVYDWLLLRLTMFMKYWVAKELVCDVVCARSAKRVCLSRCVWRAILESGTFLGFVELRVCNLVFCVFETLLSKLARLKRCSERRVCNVSCFSDVVCNFAIKAATVYEVG